MRTRTLGLAAVLAAGLCQTSFAVPRTAAEPAVVAAGRAPRAHRNVEWAKPAQLAAIGFAGWTAMVDRDTAVPLRLWGPGQPAPGTIASPAAAEQWARAFLSAHLAQLAPGASLADFTVVANELSPSGEVRSVGFQQRAGGLPVLGGAIGFAFERDHMIMVSSTALPNVGVLPAPASRLAPATISASAMTWLAAAGRTVQPRTEPAPTAAAAFGATAPGERAILPIIGARTAAGPDIQYRVVEQTTVEATVGEPGLWTVWVDAASGAPVARATGMLSTTGTVKYDTADQAPVLGRSDKAAPNANHMVNGAATQSDLAGLVTWTAAGAATVAPGLAGQFVTVRNKAGTLATASLTLPANGSVTWSLATDEFGDAQLATYVFANIVHQFAVTKLNPGLAWLETSFTANVNENATCNAQSDGTNLHFFRSDGSCENTGRMADVVYHEFGHSMHNHSVIPGVGQFEGALSEGLADTMGEAITGDSGLGRGFFRDNSPLRELNPTVKKKWPDDVSAVDPHATGEIIGETLWDLRQLLQQHLGVTTGYTQWLKIYYSVMQRSSDIPTSYAAALVGDDDDGNLGNGTPNICDLAAAFGVHGLADPAAALQLTPPSRENYLVTFTAASGSGAPACANSASVTAVNLAWRVHGGTDALIPLAGGTAGAAWTATIPSQADGTVVEYKVVATLSTGGTRSFPDNIADPYYQFYVGPTTKIWCADFEDGGADWTHRAGSGQQDQWSVGPPLADPTMAHGGANVLGMTLNGDTYASSTSSQAEGPDVDLGGATTVHLQYWRWLGVEDGIFDTATVQANGMEIWKNAASLSEPQQESDEINHVDREWRFQDIDVSAQIVAGKLKLHFDLASDQGLEFTGWTLDDVCLVKPGAPAAACGDGHVDTGETCDDGNVVDGDGCSATCQTEDGGGGGGKDDGGCCSTSGGGVGSLSLGALVLGLALRRRRR